MKKLLLLALAIPAIVFAQSYPSPTFNSVILQNPLTPANGGTGATTSTGTGSVVLSNSPSLASPTITGSLTATGLVTLPSLAVQAANTVIANATGSSASPTAFAMPSCSGTNNALRWTSGTGFTCASSIALTSSGLNQFAATTSAQLAGVISDETGTGSLVFANGPTFVGNVTLGYTAPNLLINDTSGSNASQITLQQSGSTQWSLSSSIGHNFNIGRSSGGTFVDNPLSINQSSGLVTMPDGAAITGGSINNAPIGATTANTGAFTSLSASGTISGAGFSNYLASPPAIGATTANAGTFTTLTATTPVAGTNSTRVATTAFVAGHSPCPSILDYGGDNTNTNDNSAAFSSTLAVGPANNACVYFPPGQYKFTQAISYTLPSSSASVTVLGAGAEVSQLIFSGSINGLTINYPAVTNSAHVRGLSFITTAASSSTIGLSLNQSGTAIYGTVAAGVSDVTDVIFRGSDGYQVVNRWGYAASVTVNNVNFISDGFWGASAINGGGITFAQSGANYAVQENITDSIFSGLAVGISYGANVQGVSVSQSNFTNVARAIYVPPSISGTSQLTVQGSQFNCTNYCIDEETGVDSTLIVGNLFFINSPGNALYFNPASNTTVVGNAFAPSAGGLSSTTGITFNAYKSFSSVVTGNQFSGLTTAINLTSGAKNVNVSTNAYTGNTNNVINNCSSGCTVGVATP